MGATLHTDSEWQVFVCTELDKLLLRWPVAENEPRGVGPLSSGEFAALALACGHEKLLRSPMTSFLLLDGWLQRWVLRHRGMTNLIGSKLGENCDR